MSPEEDVQNFRVRVAKNIDDHEKKLVKEPGYTQFICSVNGDQY